MHIKTDFSICKNSASYGHEDDDFFFGKGP